MTAGVPSAPATYIDIVAVTDFTLVSGLGSILGVGRWTHLGKDRSTFCYLTCSFGVVVSESSEEDRREVDGRTRVAFVLLNSSTSRFTSDDCLPQEVV
jgi:hypothetical protein